MLRVWLPLTKDLRQQGLSNVTVTNSNATINNTGKLGNCYYFNGSNARISCSSQTWDYPLSICGWFKPTDITNSNTQYWLSYNTASGGTAGHAIGIGTFGGKFGIWYGGTQYYNFTQTLSNDVWYHIAVTITANKTVSTYLNGELIDSRTFSSNNPGSSWFTLGARSNSSTGGVGGALYFYKGYMNDARLYDHCLSPMEVKELAKGLVLHYPLNRQGWGQENLYVGTRDFSGSSWGNYSRWTTESSTYNGFTVKSKTTEWGGLCQNIPATNGDIFTISFWAKVESGGTLISIDRSNLGNVTTGLSIIGGNFTSGRDWVLSSQNATQWKYYWGTVQIVSSDITYLQWRIENSVANKKLSVCGFKLEKGNKPTPWCPNSADTLATTMGLNSTTEYDCSGFCNNGIRTGTFTWTSDTPKYQVSQFFNGTDNVITLPSISNLLQDVFTMNIWFRKDELGSKNYETLFGGPSGFEMDTRANSASVLTLYMTSTRGGNVYTGFQFGEWYMVTLVNDGINELYYVNGELVKTITKKTMPIGTYYIGSWQTIDKQNYKGFLSDVRIYATALSASDVKSLYQNSAYIDSSGNVYGAVHSEV